METSKDIIAAQATPPGEGALCVIRVSGRGCLEMVSGIFKPHGKSARFEEAEPFMLTLGMIADPVTGEALDEVTLVKMPAPKSYTGEDMVEITSHGGRAVPAAILELLVRRGARIAEPGEFTRRAFLNGKMDLSRAEAVCDLVSARSELARRIALGQLEGELSKRITDAREKTLDVMAEIEARIDFPEEDIETVRNDRLLEAVNRIEETLRDSKKGARKGLVSREGVRVVLAGRTNVGKSCLFNCLVGKERALVTPHPGTTRDFIETTLEMQGVPVTLVDTAGMRNGVGEIESMGIDVAKKEIDSAETILFIVDGSEALSDEDSSAFESVRHKKVVVVVNKSDLEQKTGDEELRSFFKESISQQYVQVSALKSLGIEALEDVLYNTMLPEDDRVEAETPFVSNLRHLELIERAIEGVRRVRAGLDRNESEDLIAIDLNEIKEALDLILGIDAGEDVLDRIFSKFCIGK